MFDWLKVVQLPCSKHGYDLYGYMSSQNQKVNVIWLSVIYKLERLQFI